VCDRAEHVGDTNELAAVGREVRFAGDGLSTEGVAVAVSYRLGMTGTLEVGDSTCSDRSSGLLPPGLYRCSDIIRHVTLAVSPPRTEARARGNQRRL
jgi:hypothetical protein